MQLAGNRIYGAHISYARRCIDTHLRARDIDPDEASNIVVDILVSNLGPPAVRMCMRHTKHGYQTVSEMSRKAYDAHTCDVILMMVNDCIDEMITMDILRGDNNGEETRQTPIHANQTFANEN
jgi:hypothetical protein